MKFDALPRVLCGPILRRVDDRSVTVWLVLKKVAADQPNYAVKLVVRLKGGDVVMTGEAAPTTLGRLHVAVVRATDANEASALVPGKTYTYNLSYDDQPLLDEQTAGECRFEFMPADLQRVQVAHASCRKPNGAGSDALAALRREIVAKRIPQPHLLLLTGDQIYADGVAGPLLFMIMDAIPALLGGLTDPDAAGDKDLEPYERIALLERANIRHSYPPHSHLVSFQEYLLMYLFVWADTLWGGGLPTIDAAADRLLAMGYQYPKYDDEDRARWAADCAALLEFRKGLPEVRSLLRSTPTLMIFDDHDVTDDWRINKKWVKDVIGTPLGQRIERNALLAYILAQASGNDAETFRMYIEDIFRGTDVAKWRHRGPETEGLSLSGLYEAITYFFDVELPACHVVVLDTRTMRDLDSGLYPSLIAGKHVARQVGESTGKKKPLLLVSPPPLFGHESVEALQKLMAENRELNEDVYRKINEEDLRHIRGASFDPLLNVDAEAWGLVPSARNDLLDAVFAAWKDAPFIVVFSGDIHYAFTQTVRFTHPAKISGKKLIQVTSSAAQNHETKALAIGLMREDLIPGMTILEKYWVHSEDEYRYNLTLHDASVAKADETSLLNRLLLSLLAPAQNLERAKRSLRALDTYVCARNNCGVIAFPKAGELTHTLVTESLGDLAHVQWTVPL